MDSIVFADPSILFRRAWSWRSTIRWMGERMTDYPDPESYYYALHEWLSENGVVFKHPLSEPPFACTIDLNRLKIGMEILIQACGGDSENLVKEELDGREHEIR